MKRCNKIFYLFIILLLSSFSYAQDVVTSERTLYFLIIKNSKENVDTLFINNVKYKPFENFLDLGKSRSLKKAKTALKKIIRLGIRPMDVKIVKKEIVTEKKQIIKSEEEIDTSSEEQSSLALAKSKIKFELQNNFPDNTLNYFGSYLYIRTGAEFIKDNLEIKLTGRFEQHKEMKTVNYSFDETVLDEAYAKLEKENYSITVGNQLFAWGALDEFSAFDQVNLKNLRRFVFDNQEDLRRPIMAARVQYYTDKWKVDGFYNHVYNKGMLVDDNSLWSGVNKTTGRLRGVERNTLLETTIQMASSFKENRDSDGYGIRISTQRDWGDISFNYIKMQNGIPAIRLSEELKANAKALVLTADGLSSGYFLYYPEITTIGADLTYDLSGNILKIETAMVNDTPFLTKAYDTELVNGVAINIGAEVPVEWKDSTLNIQVNSIKYDPSAEVFNQTSSLDLIGEWESKFMQDKLIFKLTYFASLKESNYYFGPKFEYSINDDFIGKLSYYNFSGDDNQLFGYHHENRQINFGFDYLF